MFVLGIDVGTQGARAIIADLEGSVKSEAAQSFGRAQLTTAVPGHFEAGPASLARGPVRRDR